MKIRNLLMLIFISSLHFHTLFSYGENSSSQKVAPLKIFILAGQSNMVGFGAINGPQGTMEALVKSQAGKYAHLVGDHGQAIPRNDVWIVDLSTETKQGYLSTGFGAKPHHIGPEYAFGIELGTYRGGHLSESAR